MSNGRRTFLSDSASLEKSQLARKHLSRKEFGQRLYRAMLNKGWNQSELARQADILRDSVSNYIRGNNLPDPVNLEKLSKALGVPAADLLPNFDEQAIDMEANPSLEIRASAQDPSRSWVRINREVRTGTVVKLMQVLAEDEAGQ